VAAVEQPLFLLRVVVVEATILLTLVLQPQEKQILEAAVVVVGLEVLNPAETAALVLSY
jgi:hypothetical protein